MFLVMRALAEGVRIYAASIVLSAVLATSLPNMPNLTIWSIVIVGVLTLIYTFEGGIAAVIWTDLIQLIIYIGGSLVAAYMLLTLVPGGWNQIYAEGAAANKFQMFSFTWSSNLPFTFWAGVIGGTFLTMASHGTDQLLVQRLLTCKNQRDSQKALILSGFVVFFQFAAIPDDRRDALRILQSYAAAEPGTCLGWLPCGQQMRPDISAVYRRSVAARNFGPCYRGHLCRRYVESKWFAQFTGINDDSRFL